MATDKNGRTLVVGDLVTVKYEVISISDYLAQNNVSLRTLIPYPMSSGLGYALSKLNSTMVEWLPPDMIPTPSVPIVPDSVL